MLRLTSPCCSGAPHLWRMLTKPNAGTTVACVHLISLPSRCNDLSGDTGTQNLLISGVMSWRP